MVTHRSILRGVVATAAAITLGATVLSAQQKCPAVQKGAIMPLKYQGGSTVAAITACDLMTRLYIYADDSMMGREAGTPYAIQATAYIEKEVRKLGLQPAGDQGSFFQYMPVVARSLDSGSTVTVGSTVFHAYADFTAPTANRKMSGQVIFGGTQGDTINPLTAAQVAGKIVLVRPGQQGAGGGRGAGGRGAGGRGGAPGGAPNPLAGAAAIVTIGGDVLGNAAGGRGGAGGQIILADTVDIEGKAAYAAAHPDTTGRGGRGGGRGGAGGGAPTLTVTARVAEAMFGKPLAQANKGDAGAMASLDFRIKEVGLPTRSVVAILPGTDPKLKNEYIVIGGHSDHVGFSPASTGCRFMVPHDSLKAYNMIARVQGADGGRGAGAPSADQWARINSIKDSLRKIYPERTDSICNGADDDGSGSVAVLEIAEAFAKGAAKPKRSMIFIWQTGEEKGLWGSEYFTNHPTVPRDSIIADLNIDMVGRGAATDVTGAAKGPVDSVTRRAGAGPLLHGSDNYLQLVGSRRLSTEYGDLAEAVNKTEKVPLQFDYSMDANGHPQNIYCRSDHANYARYNIPVIFFTTGGHADYHQATDEPQYIQYEHMARVDQLIFDIAMKVGNLDHRIKVDPASRAASPFGPCVQ